MSKKAPKAPDFESFVEGIYDSIDFDKQSVDSHRIHWEFERFKREAARAYHEGYGFGFEHGYTAGLKDGDVDG